MIDIFLRGSPRLRTSISGVLVLCLLVQCADGMVLGEVRLHLPVFGQGKGKVLAARSVMPFCERFEVQIKNSEFHFKTWHSRGRLVHVSTEVQPEYGEYGENEKMKPANARRGIEENLQSVGDGVYRFAVQKFYGNWTFSKWLEKPRLQEIEFVPQSSEASGESNLACHDLVIGFGPEWSDMHPVDIWVNTAHVFNWMRGPSELDVARYVARRIAQAIEGGKLDPTAQELLLLDVACGSGWLSVLVAAKLRSLRMPTINTTSILCTDISGEALEVAAQNVKRNGLEDFVSTAVGDLLQPVKGMAAPRFVFFVPPQGSDSARLIGPDVAVVPPSGGLLKLFEKFLLQASEILSANSIVWLGIDPNNVPEVIGALKYAGWHCRAPSIDAVNEDRLGSMFLEAKLPSSPEASSDPEWEKSILTPEFLTHLSSAEEERKQREEGAKTKGKGKVKGKDGRKGKGKKENAREKMEYHYITEL